MKKELSPRQLRIKHLEDRVGFLEQENEALRGYLKRIEELAALRNLAGHIEFVQKLKEFLKNK